MFQKEIKHYEDNKRYYLKRYKDKFVVIKGSRFLGAFGSEENAYKAGLEEFGNQAFLIKKVDEKEPTTNIPALFVGVKNASF